MSKPRFSPFQLALSGIIAGIYVGLTLSLPLPPYRGIQLRVAEAMTLLPFLFPEAIWGLTVGCFLTNLLGSPFILDWVFGTLATLLAALWTRKMPNKWLAALPPVLCNAAIVGAEIAYSEVQFSEAFWSVYGLNALTVGLGELVACYAFGIPLISWIVKTPALSKLAQR